MGKLTGVLLVLSLLYLLPLLTMNADWYVYDEGLVLVGAERVGAGQLPCRDFWTMYPPGQYYSLAALFKVFGTSLVVARGFDLVVKILLSVSGFALTRIWGFPIPTALTAWGLLLVWLETSGFPGFPGYPALLWIFLGIGLFLHQAKDPDRGRGLLFCGTAMTAGAMFRHDLAGLAAAGTLASLILRRLVDADVSWRRIAHFLLAVILPGLLVVLCFLPFIGLMPVIGQLILTPAEIMPRFRALPYPTALALSSIPFYLLPGTLFIGLGTSLRLILKRTEPRNVGYGMFTLSCIGILFLNQVRVRSDQIHLLPAALVSLTLIPGLFTLAWTSAPNRWRWRASLLLAILLLGAALIEPVAAKIGSFRDDYLVMPAHSPIPRAGFARLDQEYQDLIAFIRANTAENEAIYVGVKNHDRFIFNDVILYFLADRRCAVRYHELHPGVSDTSPVQQEIIEGLERASVRMAILVPRYWIEENETRNDARIDLLDRFIENSFALTRKFGEFEVWTRR